MSCQEAFAGLRSFLATAQEAVEEDSLEVRLEILGDAACGDEEDRLRVATRDTRGPSNASQDCELLPAV